MEKKIVRGMTVSGIACKRNLRERNYMKAGNLSQTVWRRSVLKQLYIEKEQQLLSPVPGERCCAESTGETGICIHAHAVSTGKSAAAVKYALFQAANDAVCRGAAPKNVDLQVLFPVSSEEEEVRKLLKAAQQASGQLAVKIRSFQAQVNPAVERIIASVTVSGGIAAGKTAASGSAAQRLIRMQDTGAGSEIVMCGFAGLEGSLRIAEEYREELEKRFVPAFLRQTQELERHLNQTETIRAALNAAGEEFHISAVQQAASGGVFAALWELAEAAGVGMEVDLKKIQVCQETVEICEYYLLNPYQMTSAGCILFLTDYAEKLIELLEKSGARAERLGVTTAGNARVITSGEEQRYLERPAPDEWMRFLEQELNQKEVQHGK